MPNDTENRADALQLDYSLVQFYCLLDFKSHLQINQSLSAVRKSYHIGFCGQRASVFWGSLP